MWSAGLLPRSANLGSVGLSLVPDPANSPSFPLAQVGLGMPQVSAGQLSLRHSLLANIINTPGSPLLILLTFLEIHVLQAKVPKSPWVLALAKPKQTYHCRVPLPLAEQSSLTGICCSQRNRDRQWQGPVLLAMGILRAEEQKKKRGEITPRAESSTHSMKKKQLSSCSLNGAKCFSQASLTLQQSTPTLNTIHLYLHS